MLWVHIADDGTADCLVNDGNKLRQGNSFELFVVSGRGESKNEPKQYALNDVAYIKPSELEYSTDGVAIEQFESMKTFYTDDVNKLGSFFVNQKDYWGRKVFIPEQATTFNGNGGHISLKISMFHGEEVVYVDNLSLYVMPTYGKTPTLITKTEYQNILNKIQTYFKSVEAYDSFDEFPEGAIAQQTAGEVLYVDRGENDIYFYNDGYIRINIHNLEDGVDGTAVMARSTSDEDADTTLSTKDFVDKKVIIRRW